MENQPQNPIPEIKPAHHLPLKYWLPILIAATLLAGVGIFYLADSFDKDLSSEVSVSDAQQMMHKDPEDMSDWKTYRNEEFGFEFQYPKPPLDEDVNEHQKPGSKEIALDFYLGRAANINFFISSYDDAPKPGDKCIGINVNSIGAVQCKGLGTANFYFITTFIKKDGISYYISFSTESEQDKDLIDLHNKVLDTFKFIEPSQNETIGWKTYRNEQFEFQYPADWYGESCGLLGFLVSYDANNAICGSIEPNKDGNILFDSTTEKIYFDDYAEAGLTQFTKENIQVNNVAAVKYLGISKNGPFGDNTREIIILFSQGNVTYVIIDNIQDQQHDKDLEKILTTFKFTK